MSCDLKMTVSESFYFFHPNYDEFCRETLFKQLMELTMCWFLAKALRQGRLKLGAPGEKYGLVILVAAGPRRT